ncbi:MAG TPA: carboxymuconolactone decarboxylase family protein [Acidimicrobiales bacterium]|nr:carboxymuconolactone decarboxylase family protein [Acidimicrobiales bacterium]
MTEWTSRDDRQRAARAEFEHIMTTPGPDPSGAYIDAGVIGFVFGEMWRRGVLSARDRRLITLSCVGAAGAVTPVETHVWAALSSGDLTFEEFDEFVLHFATQVGWPKGSLLNMHGMMAMNRLCEQRGESRRAVKFEPWADPAADDVRRVRGVEAYRQVHGGKDPEPAATAFRGRAYLDYLYGEIWTRQSHLTRRDRRIISICCSAAVGVDEETLEHLGAALDTGELGFDELQELVLHYAVYLGWPLGRRLDDLLVRQRMES